jgi:insulysin
MRPELIPYVQFVAQNGGSTNAYTSTTNTNYHFSVSASALPGALERFSAFFHSPLFAPSCTARELNAVDSENKKNRQSDTWRLFQLDKSLSAPDSPWRKFGTGNWESLMARDRPQANGTPNSNGSKSNGTATPLSHGSGEGGDGGREVRAILLEWYAQHYSANRMTLAILGKGFFSSSYHNKRR